MSAQQWYVKVESRTVGPLSTDLVLRGMADGELPSSALVCRAGAFSWLPLSSVPPFSKSTGQPPAASGLPAATSSAATSGARARPPVSAAYEALRKPGGLRAAAVSAAHGGLGGSHIGQEAAGASVPARAPGAGTDRQRPNEVAAPQDAHAQLLPPPGPAATASAGRTAELAPVPGGLLASDDFASEDFSDDELLEEELPSDVHAVRGVSPEHPSAHAATSGPASVGDGPRAVEQEALPSSEQLVMPERAFVAGAVDAIGVAPYESTQQEALTSLGDDTFAAFEADAEPIHDLQPLLEPDEPAPPIESEAGARTVVDAEADTVVDAQAFQWTAPGDGGHSSAIHAAPIHSLEAALDSPDGAGAAGSIAPELDVEASPSLRISPTRTLSVARDESDNGPGPARAEVSPSPVLDIDESDFADLFDDESAGGAAPPEAFGAAATLRSDVLGSDASEPGEQRPSIVVTPQVVISERLDAAELRRVDATVAPELGAVETARAPGNPTVRAGQTVIIPREQIELELAEARKDGAAEDDNPFMTGAEVVPRASARAEPDNDSAPGYSGAPGVAEIDIEQLARAFDWTRQFCGYFQLEEAFELPDQRMLLRSLQQASLDVLVQPEAMWNLAVCLALGSDALANVAADAFFRIMMAYPDRDRLDWMARVLLSRGFLPSGIPLAAGQRAIRLLEAHCPAELRPPLSDVLAE